MATARLQDFGIKELLLNQPPLLPLALTFFYLVFILKLGPTLMKNRHPFKLRSLLVIYNLSQISINAYIFFKSVQLYSQVSIYCRPVTTLEVKLLPEVLTVQDLYILLKLYDYLDTIFFVLRKKHEQISFLHVYHHVGMFLFCWTAGKYFPSSEELPPGPALSLVAINSFVHAVMYVYYLLSSLDLASVKFAWWKRYITVLQLAQHCALFSVCVVTVLSPTCPYHKGIGFFCAINLLLIIYLFIKFYQRAYCNKKD